MNQTLNIIMTSDFICPWCFVTERRLRKVAADKGIEIKIRYRPYELNPDMPEEGLNRKEYRSKKFGSWEHSTHLDAGTIQASQNDPVEFDYDAIKFTPNTRNAHRLVWYVQNNHPDCEEDIVDRLFEGYFSKGLDIGDVVILAEIASNLGISHDAVLSFLKESDEGTYEVATLEQEALDAGLRGVPSIQMADEQLYGAESAGNMGQALHKALNNQNNQVSKSHNVS
ncbi:DsbA family oxidoreductase [Marinicella sp. W31]|uniref:DsbA family oxidoreductase n=1 Tax=Marinicella sp. W31 TaxID=3023713 RepID=UPI003757516F